MTFNQRATTVLQLPVSPLTWDGILKECDRLEEEFLHIPSGYKWALDYKRFQVEQARGNASASLAWLKTAIATMPYNSEIIGDYKNVVKKSSGVKNIVMIVSSKKSEAKALRLAAQFDNANIEYMIVSGSDAPSIKHVRALQVSASDAYEGTPKKVAAALTWVYENIGDNVGVLKLEDRMSLREPEKLRQSLAALAQENAYAGVRSADLDHDRCQHWGECRDPALNRRVYGKPVLRPWANGGAYYLGAGPLEKVVMALIRFPGLFDGEYYEDKLIGDALVFEAVEPKFVNSYADFGLAEGI
ncbi:hypothetical protein [Herbaspirillum rhizosphaerae]|uniref:hypothetical protein n=1 Tax=Herbaspirillum rhizosphaerae TaxID=346179 RepID=UPI00067C4E42|nr:hypothetical protein [Herbaspirillum rhizosphaerae]